MSSFAHLTLATRDVDATASFFEKTLGYTRIHVPGNTPMEAAWLDIGRGQQFHIIHVAGFQVSPFEDEFGRHIAIFHPGPKFGELKQKLTQHGAQIVPPKRETPFERFFFKEPVNGYVFEVIDQEKFIKE